jgi:hypothetical protein
VRQRNMCLQGSFLFKRNWALCLVAGLTFWGSSVALAEDDARDDSILGNQAPVESNGSENPSSLEQAQFPKGTSSISSGASTFSAQETQKTLEIGGAAELGFSLGLLPSQEKPEKWEQGTVEVSPTLELYFDGRPNEFLRSMVRLKVFNTPEKTQLALEEGWIKVDFERTFFFTIGRQRMKWGSGRFWNPTDFLARGVKDPFASREQRLGQDLLRLHIPWEKSGQNLYAVLDLTDTAKPRDAQVGIRHEVPLFGMAEVAASAAFKANAPRRFGLDASFPVWLFDVRTENALLQGKRSSEVKGGLNTDNPLRVEASPKRSFLQHLVGLDKTFKYSDTDSVTFSVEYFRNGLGYEDRVLQTYALVSGLSPSLYSGRDYWSGFVLLPNPGTWNSSSFQLSGVQNVSDKTAQARAQWSQTFQNDLLFEMSYGRCFGTAGELCFAVPREFLAVAAQSVNDPSLAERVLQLPTEPVRHQIQMSLRMNF